VESFVGDFRWNLQNACISQFAWLLQFKVRSICHHTTAWRVPVCVTSHKSTWACYSSPCRFSSLCIQFSAGDNRMDWAFTQCLLSWLQEREARMHVALTVGSRFNLWQTFELVLFIFPLSLHRVTSTRPNSSFQIPSYSSFISGSGSSVGIATGYGLDGTGIESRWGEILRTSPDRPWGPPSLLYNGYLVFPGGKERPGRDADPSPPSSTVVKKE